MSEESFDEDYIDKSDLESRIRSIVSSDSRDRWNDLVNILKIVKAHPLGTADRFYLSNLIQEGFETFRDQSKQYAEDSEKSFAALSEKIDGIRLQLDDLILAGEQSANGNLGKIYHSIREVQDMITDEALIKDHRASLRDAVQAVFDHWAQLKSEQSSVFDNNYRCLLETGNQLRSELDTRSYSNLGDFFHRFKEFQSQISKTDLMRDQRIELKELDRSIFNAWLDIKSDETYAHFSQDLQRFSDDISDKERIDFAKLDSRYKKLEYRLNNLKIKDDQSCKLIDSFKMIREQWKQISDEQKQYFQKLAEKKQAMMGVGFSGLDLPDCDTPSADADVAIADVPKPVSEFSVDKLMEIYPKIFSFSENTSKKSEFRKQQIQYLLMAYEGLQTGRDVVIEGPTGLGKTRALFAAVFPFLLDNPKARVLYATRTIAQVNSVIKDLRDIVKANALDITGSLFLGKSKVVKDLVCCYDEREDLKEFNLSRLERGLKPYDSSFCNPGCKIFFDYRYKYDKQGDLNESPFDFKAHPVIGLEELLENKKLCPIRLYEEASEDARIIVAPHNYLYDTYWRRNLFKPDEQVMLIVDEAHNFLSDANGKPFLTIKGSYSKKELEEESELFSDNRTDNTYFIHEMAKQLAEIFKNSSSKFKIKDIPVIELFTYLEILYKEMSDVIMKFNTPERAAGTDEQGPLYLIAESSIDDLVSSLGEPFVDNLKRLRNLINIGKSDIKTASAFFRNKVEKYLYSYSQIIDNLLKVIENPYDFLLLSSNHGKFEFYNLHPKMNVNEAISWTERRIFTSATLSPPEEVAYLLDLPGALHAKIDPVFDDANYKPFFVLGVNSSSKEELKEVDDCLTPKERVVLTDLFKSALYAAKGRNIGVFCNNNRMVVYVYNVLSDLRSELGFSLLTYMGNTTDAFLREHIIDFKRDFSEFFDQHVTRLKNKLRSRKDLELEVDDMFNDTNVINAFKLLGYDTKQTGVLLGVQGGSLSEGIDYFGKQMEMVITVGLPYPASATEIKMNKIKENYFLMQRGDRSLGEDLAYKLEAFRKLAQSIGRAHRRMTDRAVIICVDERLVGVKNVKSEGYDRYEFLSIPNAQKNLKVLQRPMSFINKNIVCGGYDKGEDKDLKSYISSGLCSNADFISYADMVKQITDFYKQGD